MTCENWAERLDIYLDGELPSEEARAVDEHLRGCPTCAAEGLRRVQMKRAVQNAGQRFTPGSGISRAHAKNICVGGAVSGQVALGSQPW